MGNPRLTYNSINIDFDRCLNRYEHSNLAVINQEKALNGKVETLYFSNSEALEIEKQRMSRTVEAQLESFWSYARQGQSFSFKFDRELLGYWTFDNTTTNNDSLTGTFTRTGAANYVHPGTGLVTSAAENAERYQSGNFGSGILLEQAMSQICLRTAEFDNASWTATGITVGANTAETLDPLGTTTSEKCTLTAATGTLVQDLSGAADIGTQDAVFSVYAKWYSGSSAPGGLKLRIKRADTGAVLVEDAAYQDVVPEQWTRYSIAYTNAGAIAAKWRLEIELKTDSAIYYVFGANFETDKRYPTSYLAATSAATSRGAELLYYTASSIFPDEPYQGSCSFWIYPLFVNTTNDSTHTFFYLERFGASAPLVEVFCSSTTLFATIDGKGGSVLASASEALSNILTSQAWTHIVATWDTSIANSVKLYVNGTLVDTSTNDEFGIARRGTNFYIGGSSEAAQAADAIIDDVEVRSNVLSAAEILYRYNSGKALGWRRNYFSSLVLNQDEYSPRLLQGAYRHDVPLKFLEQK